MMATGAILFLIGTINSLTIANPIEPTEILIEKHINPAFEKLMSHGLQRGLPPFISNFMQHGTNLFFKPQFNLSPSYVASEEGMLIENKEDCKKWPVIPAFPFAAQPPIVMDEPVKIVETIVSDGEPPAIDKVIMINPSGPMTPELSMPPMVISPLPEPELIVSNPVVFPETPALPQLPIIPVPMETVEIKPELIPSAPELPPLEMPQAPLTLNEPAEIAMVEVSQPAMIEEIKPVLIPEAPELPSLPVASIPYIPIVPEPKPEAAPYVEVYENIVPLHIPEAPVLPPYSPPTLPLPVILPETAKECDKAVLLDFPAIEEAEPFIIPQAPVLPSPAVTFTDFIVPQPAPEPIKVEMKPVEIPPAPVLPEFQEPMEPSPIEYTIPEIIEIPQKPIPNPPELPPMSLPNLPLSVVVSEPMSVPHFDEPHIVETMPPLIEEPIFKPMEIPAAPVLPPMAPISLPVAVETLPVNTIEQEILTNEITLVDVSDPILPVTIPETPLLPLAPEMSVPVKIEETSSSNEESKPLNIPTAPELPPLSFPYLPVPIEEPVGLYPLAEFTPMIVEEPKLPQLFNFPMMMPQDIEISQANPSLSQVESIISFPTSCVKNIVIERVLPNIVREGIDVASPSPNYPVLSPFSRTVGIRLY